MKKLLPVFLVVFLAGCSAVSTPVSTENTSEETTVSLQELSLNDTPEISRLTALFDKIKENTSLGQTMQVSENNILNRYGIDTADLDDYIFEEPATGENADTFIIVECKTDAIVSQVKSALEAQLENAKTTTQNYSPEQYVLYNNSVIDTKGNCVYWVVSDNPEEIVDIINNSIE
jgi:PBP1b-binding outer membrane lipoprotein LpoB